MSAVPTLMRLLSLMGSHGCCCADALRAQAVAKSPTLPRRTCSCVNEVVLRRTAAGYGRGVRRTRHSTGPLHMSTVKRPRL
jgi:hypothetical protein